MSNETNPVAIVLVTSSTNPEYSGECDYAVVRLTPELVEQVRRRVELARQAGAEGQRPLRTLLLGRHGGFLRQRAAGCLPESYRRRASRPGMADRAGAERTCPRASRRRPCQVRNEADGVRPDDCQSQPLVPERGIRDRLDYDPEALGRVRHDAGPSPGGAGGLRRRQVPMNQCRLAPVLARSGRGGWKAGLSKRYTGPPAPEGSETV